MRLALSGTGRIGRLVLRKAFSQPMPEAEIVAINTTTSPQTLAHLLQYDSVHRQWEAKVEATDDALFIDGKRIAIVSERSPERLPWSALGIDTVIDATGKFNNRDGVQRHKAAGARRVLVTAPGDKADFTFLMGVNDNLYDSHRHFFVSAASCTTNCLAPLLYVLDCVFGVEQGWMTTVHAFTGDQNHLDNSHRDLRRARSCTQSIIPTTTGAGSALRDVLPALADRIHGVSIRVPVADVSLLDLQVQLKSPVTKPRIHELFKDVAAREGSVIGYSDLPLVSADYIGNDKSAVVDGPGIMVRDDQVKLLAWYDNEWGYASRVVDVARHMAREERNMLLGAKTGTAY